jgi:hypothetical protein
VGAYCLHGLEEHNLHHAGQIAGSALTLLATTLPTIALPTFDRAAFPRPAPDRRTRC